MEEAKRVGDSDSCRAQKGLAYLVVFGAIVQYQGGPRSDGHRMLTSKVNKMDR
jgi:hypothetical protein